MMHEFNLVMTPNEVVLISYLYHHHDLCVNGVPKQWRRAGWFWCTAATVERNIHWDEKKQQRVIKKLVNKGYIDREQHCKRNPEGVSYGQPVRWLRLNTAKIVADIDEKLDTRMWSAAEESEAV